MVTAYPWRGSMLLQRARGIRLVLHTNTYIYPLVPRLSHHPHDNLFKHLCSHCCNHAFFGLSQHKNRVIDYCQALTTYWIEYQFQMESDR